MILTQFDDWLKWANDNTYTMLPYVRKYVLSKYEDGRVLTWKKAWSRASAKSFVFESGKAGRYTYLGLQSVSSIRGDGNTAEVTGDWDCTRERCIGSDRKTSIWHGKPLELVKRWMNSFRSPRVLGTPRFIGGCVGYWGYDVARSIEKLPEYAVSDLSFPDYFFMRIEELWMIDHETRELYCAVHVPIGDHVNAVGAGDSVWLRERYTAAEQRVHEMKDEWDAFTELNDEEVVRQVKYIHDTIASDERFMNVDLPDDAAFSFDKESFMNAVRQVQDYIGQGDVFQVNLSVRQSKPLDALPEDIYEWLRVVNPSPYMGLLRTEDFKLVSGSPELLVRLEDGEVYTRPIAGTRPRGRTDQEDRELAKELLASDKERAEHIMLVDLERNDIGKIAKFGTVKVSDFMVIEPYSHVMHIVSEVKGSIVEGKDAFDVIAAAFPGGTITGAPKIRTMEIIELLEPVRRGPYTGSLGWIDYNGNMEFNIIIRTLAESGGIGYVQAGAGIVIDSDPEKEYIESLNKAKALWKAVHYSEQAARSGFGGMVLPGGASR